MTIVSWKIFIHLGNKYSLSSMLADIPGDIHQDTCKDDQNSSLSSRTLSWRGLPHRKVQSDYYSWWAFGGQRGFFPREGSSGPSWKSAFKWKQGWLDLSRLAMSCYKNGTVCNFQLNANILLMIGLWESHRESALCIKPNCSKCY